MATIQEDKVTPEWVDDLYQIEMTDPVTGGSDGVANRQAKQLGQRTQWLRKAHEKTLEKVDELSNKKGTLENIGFVQLVSELSESDESNAATPKGVLEAIAAASVSVGSIDELREYPGSTGYVNVNGYYVNTPGIGGGMFVADQSDTTSADNGGTIIVSANGVRWRRLLDGVCRFSDFGVLAGKQNAPTTLNKINALFKFVYEAKIPKVLSDIPGDYYLNGLIRIGDNLEFESVDGVRYLRNTSGAMLYNGLVINDNSSQENPCRNIKIFGGEFNSNAKEQWSSVNFFSLGYIDGLEVSGVRFVDCIRNHAIDLSACRNVTIEKNQFLGFSKEVSTVYGTAPGSDIDRGFSEAIQIDDNVPGTFTGGRLKGDPCENVVVRNNVFSKNPDDDTGLFGQGYGCAVGGHYAARNVQHHNNIIVEDNLIEYCGFAGVRPFLWDNVKIVNNTFKHCHRNIYIWWLQPTNNPSEAGRDYHITGNHFGDTVAEQILTQIWGNGYTGAWEKLKNISILSNVFGNTQTGSLLKLQGVHNAAVADNIFDVANRFIDIEYSSKVKVSGNIGNRLEYEFLSSKNDIYDGSVGTSSEIYITANFARDCRGGVIHLQKMADVVIEGNHFFNVANAANANSIRALDVAGLRVNGNSILLAQSAVDAGVFALDVAASCSNVLIGGIITNAKTAYRNRAAGAGGVDLLGFTADNGRINALNVGAQGSASRNLVVNGLASANTPALNDNSGNLATTAWVRQMCAAAAGGNGYQKLPSGLIIQWLTINVNGADNGMAALPIAFPNAVLMAMVNDTQEGISPIHATAWNKENTTAAAIGWNANAQAGLISIIAIGH
ncbi:gp53-like domain-containing protein [Neisseria animalis]|uniref:Putative tail fiber protein gp53-like C-terminal domain-containing protein n=1 Tax=Neisseria animalis TaxID=492 RepID=A0A5P3MT34_NEIAN|nr:tail fiber protein [Neisseria animalis]QEY24688.1 hypothetical protein D0T90_09625 [Neisseria animalis]ROW31422.1 hypothetical protein CGZ60_10390 [Neisseria animalis]VEE07643.1 Plasmin and fibronectin-binding protein A precursor [Neisseria animalis]